MRALSRLLLVGFAVVLVAAPAAAAVGGGGATATGGGTHAEPICPNEHPEWRDRHRIANVTVVESRRCRPDNPYAVAAAVRGTNNVPESVLMKTGYARNAVVKRNDRDADGDPDEIHVTLEIAGINGYNETDVTHQIAPGIEPAFWAFAPKTRGMVSEHSKANRLIRMPSPTLRAESGDTVYVHVENTHYFPHTIHLHGVDHPYSTDGSANDGVPQTGRSPILPGEQRTYRFTARRAGTMFYHCHVVPNVHVTMGLNGMFVIERNRSNNSLQTMNVGAGKVRHPSRAVAANYTAEYDLVYQTVDTELHALPKRYADTRRVARQMNRRYDVTDGSSDYFLLNGRSFPYTLRESIVAVEPGSDYRLRILNAGREPISLHTHGHKFEIEAYDGVKLAERQEVTRDVVSVSAAQRVDITLNTTDDGRHSYGPGVWVFHDHREQAVTNDGISPGGTLGMIVYDRYLSDRGIPETDSNLSRYFDPAYYEGETPFWAHLDSGAFGEPPDGGNATSGSGERGAGHHAEGSGQQGGGHHADESTRQKTSHHSNTSGQQDTDHHGDGGHGGGTMMQMRMVPNGTVVNENVEQLPPGCTEIRSERSVTVRAGEEWADPGEAFGYSRETFAFEPCQRVTVTLRNFDDVRHQWMVHGLPTETYPMGMFNIEVRRNGSVTGTFVTPATNGTLRIHCSLPQHEQRGMHARIVLGDRTETTGGHAASGPSAGRGPSPATTVEQNVPTAVAFLAVAVSASALLPAALLRRE